MNRIRGEQGVALGMALTAMVVIGVLIAAAVYMSTQDYRIAANTAREARAAAAAELGLNRVVNEWTLPLNQTMKTGDTVRRSYATNGGTATVLVTRLPGLFFWAVSEGYAGGLGKQVSARRRYGSLFRLNVPNVNLLGAVTAAGNVKVSGNVTVNGNDAVPAGWPGCGPLTNVPGSVMAPGYTATVNGSVTINGNPPYTTMAAAADTNTYFNYGSSTYSSLAANASVTLAGGQTLNGLAPSVSGGVCNTALQSNWGDPVRHTPAAACETYFPIIHVLGDLHVSNGTGQGVLLVDGDLTKSGNFSFFGVVIARGTIRSSGSSNGVTGAEMAANIDLGDAVTLTGSTTIQYSSCAVMNALSGSAYPAPAGQRAWVDVF